MAIYAVFRHKVDVYRKITSTNLAGQKKPTWVLDTEEVKCHMIPRIAITRTNPTYDETETITIFFHRNSTVDYSIRLYNLKDKFGNVVETGPLEIDSVLKQPGFSGRVHHLAIKAKRVMDT